MVPGEKKIKKISEWLTDLHQTNGYKNAKETSPRNRVIYLGDMHEAPGSAHTTFIFLEGC